MTDENQDFMGYVPGAGGNYECLPEGSYDYVVHGIVGLGLRPHTFEGKELSPRAEIKVIFEIPDHKREDGQTELLSVRFPISSSNRSNYFKFCSSIFGESVTGVEDNMNKLCTATGMKEILGKTGTLSVVAWKNDKEKRSVSQKGFYPLHPKAPKPEATREFVFFNPFNPDIKVFKEKLTSWTRKSIMEAVNASEFSDELKKAYEESKAEDEAKKAEKAKATGEESSAPWAGSTEGIQ